MAELSLKFSDEPCPQHVVDAALLSLTVHSAKSNGVPFEVIPFSVLAFQQRSSPGRHPQNDRQRLVGGLIGRVLWSWLYADLLWVEDGFRGQGIGTRLMRAAEDRAREQELTGIYLWTQTWQAPAFYRKLGYEQFVEFRDFPPGHSRLGFWKYLSR